MVMVSLHNISDASLAAYISASVFPHWSPGREVKSANPPPESGLYPTQGGVGWEWGWGGAPGVKGLRKGVRVGKHRCRKSVSIWTEGRKLGPVPASERFNRNRTQTPGTRTESSADAETGERLDSEQERRARSGVLTYRETPESRVWWSSARRPHRIIFRKTET